jgi:hypothetical protein
MMPGRSACGAYVPRLDIRSALQPAVFAIGLAGALWICGCAGTGPAHAPATAATSATASSPAAAAVPAVAPTPTPLPTPNAPIGATDQAEPAPSAAPAAAAVQPAVKAKKPAADAVSRSKPDVAAAATQPVPVASAPPPVSAHAPTAAPLDLSSLKQRLRDTNAIGVFTKLALKNQVDDLLDKFRKFYGGQLKITLPQLRASYELLVEKVLVLLQDSDPPLAKEIAASREAIWSLLADPQKFATL